jgi:hypothetical protein
MKKFYISIFTAIFLLSSFFTQAQVFNSITSNPLNLTFDDPAFWVGGVAPGNPCNNCTIKIYSTVTMPQNGQSSATNSPALDHVVINGGTINVYGTTDFSINTYLELDNVTLTMGNDPTSAENLFVNAEVDMEGSTSVQLANNSSTINTNNDNFNTPILGPHLYPFGGFPLQGLFTIRGATPGPAGDVDWTLNNQFLFNYNMSPFAPEYSLNCTGGTTGTCAKGIVFGPAITSYISGFDFFGFGLSTALPVVLVQFVADKNDDGSVKVSWATSQEQNSSYYDVERSGDQAAWTKIGTVKAKGYSSTTSNYSLNDPLPINGTGYYRLKMVDLDGKFTYSKAVAVSNVKNNQALVIYSNPFTDMIRLKISVSRPQNLSITVSDMVGKTYISQSYQAQSGDNMVNLQPGTVGNGMYVLHIHGDTYDQTVKVEKQ